MPVIKAGEYSITTGPSALSALQRLIAKSKPTSIFIVCDSNTLSHCVPMAVIGCPALAEAQIIESEPGEHAKCLEVCAQIWQTLTESNADREALIVNIGGGVICDLGGFAASVYKRGIHYINVPTSLLAMGDASVGSKTGIDFQGFKNLLGTFHPPSGVFILPRFLETLPPRQKLNGYAEIVKIALVADRSLWKKLQHEQDLSRYVADSVMLKSSIVAKDPRDNGLRKILNFGHTAGHAIEASGYSTWLHGEAVAAGMIIETFLSLQKRLIPKKEALSVISFIHTQFRTSIRTVAFSSVSPFLLNDKKTSGRKLKFALIAAPGKCIHDVEASFAQVEQAFNAYNEMLND